LLAFTFHWTSIILIFVYPIYKYLHKKSFIYLFIFYLLAIFSYLLLLELLPFFKNFIDGRIYYYLFISRIYDSTNIYSIIYVFLIIIIALIWLYISKANISFFISKVSSSITFSSLAILLFLILKSFQFISYYSFLPRIQLYFYPFYIFALPELIDRLKPNYKIIIKPVLISFMIFFFVISYFEINQYASIHYESFKLINLFFRLT
jgi:hypothetical protein